MLDTNIISYIIKNRDFSLIDKFEEISIKFGIHKNQSLFIINDFMCEINDLTSTETEIIFGTKTIDSINENLLEYEIIVTGIK